MHEFERRRPLPGTLHRDVLAVVAHELADARRSIHMGNDLQHEPGLLERGQHFAMVDRAMLVAHRGERDRNLTIAQHAADRVLVDDHLRRGELLRESPDLAAPGDRRLAIEEHRVHVAATLFAEADRNHLARLRVVPEPGRIRHADEFELDDRLRHPEGRRYDRGERLRIRPVGDDQELAIDEPVGRPGIGGARQRHRERAFPHFVFIHRQRAHADRESRRR